MVVNIFGIATSFIKGVKTPKRGLCFKKRTNGVCYVITFSHQEEVISTTFYGRQVIGILNLIGC